MYKTIDVKKLLFYGLAGYCSLILLNIVSQTRKTGITFEIIMDAFKLSSSSSPIFTALEEFGNTLGSLCYTIYSNPKSAIMNYGVFNPIIRCLNAIPNLGGFLDSFQNIFYVNTNFIKSLPFSNSLGGSFLCELYFDFGEIGFMFSVFIGIMVGWVQQITFDSLENRQLVKMMYILPLFSNMLWWIRDNFIVIPREFLWNAILVYIISSIIKKRRIHRG